MSNNAAQTTVDMYFDPICPFAWVTSRWLIEASKVRNFTINWHQMSLGALNEGRDLPQKYIDMMAFSWEFGRVIDAVIEATAPEQLNETIDALYAAYGTAIHENKKEIESARTAEALEIAGLSADFAKEAENLSRDETIRGRQKEAQALVGDDVGTPVVRVGESAFFGPVITRVPTGEEAGKIFDAAVTLGEYPYFFEMKRSRTEDPQLPAITR